MATAIYTRILPAAILAAALASPVFAADNPLNTYDIAGVRLTVVEHATMVLEYRGVTLLIDPGNRGHWTGSADVVLVTHTHADHYDAALAASYGAPIVAPWTLAHSASVNLGPVRITAVPMATPGNRHHDDGNGYVIDFGSTRFWIAGDVTSLPPGVFGVDVAVIPLRPPFTWGLSAAAAAINALRPAIVIPNHFNRGDDPNALQALVSAEVRILTWYP